MPVIKLSGRYLDVDIKDEISHFEWFRPKWTEEKLIAASPFRYDDHPSFFVNLETGGWSDSGAFDADFESGNLAKLLAFLRDETYGETLEYLTELYEVKRDDESGKVWISTINLRERRNKVALNSEYLGRYSFRHPYLGRRGITDKVQQFMSVGYDKGSKSVTIPWRHADGSLANIKFRKVEGKVFWYVSGGAPVRSLVYGIDKVYRHNLEVVVVCEAEIDAMSWYVCGMPAVALGGTAVTDKQLDLIRKSPVKAVYIAEDNDQSGRKMGETITEKMRGYVDVKHIKIPDKFSDANEALVAGVSLQDLEERPTINVFKS